MTYSEKLETTKASYPFNNWRELYFPDEKMSFAGAGLLTCAILLLFFPAFTGAFYDHKQIKPQHEELFALSIFELCYKATS